MEKISSCLRPFELRSLHLMSYHLSYSNVKSTVESVLDEFKIDLILFNLVIIRSIYLMN